jgi:SAM-dependent methyltransferase
MITRGGVRVKGHEAIRLTMDGSGSAISRKIFGEWSVQALMRRIARWSCVVAVLAAGQAVPQSVDKADQDYWNRKFSDPKTKFRREPSPLLMDAIRDRKPGDAIDLGMGDGRNTIFLAQRGWKATGVDLSDVGIAQAKARAAQVGVKIAVIVDSLDRYQLGTNRWDLIAGFTRMPGINSRGLTVRIVCWRR